MTRLRFPLDAARKKAGVAVARTVSHEESDLQISLVKAFDSYADSTTAMLFAVPNGGARDAMTGGILKAEGVRAGVADLVLLTSGGVCTFLEVKLPERHTLWAGRQPATKQSASQVGFEERVTALGFRYVVVRSGSEFVSLVEAAGGRWRVRPNFLGGG